MFIKSIQKCIVFVIFPILKKYACAIIVQYRNRIILSAKPNNHPPFSYPDIRWLLNNPPPYSYPDIRWIFEYKIKHSMLDENAKRALSGDDFSCPGTHWSGILNTQILADTWYYIV